MLRRKIDEFEAEEALQGKSALKRNPLKVCMIVYSFYETDTRVMQYATALAERGDTVDVIALKRSESQLNSEVISGVTVHRIQSRELNEKGVLGYARRIIGFAFRAAMFLRKRHKAVQYNLVHVHNMPDFLIFSAMAPKLSGVPVILDIHDLLPEFYASKFKINHKTLVVKVLLWTERWSAAFADHVIVANHIWCDRLASRSSRAEKCSVVRNRPDLSIFKEQSKASRKDDKFVITYPGSLNWHQGLDIAIRAFSRVADDLPDAEFNIYGEGAAKNSLIELTKQLKLEHRIKFFNYLPSAEVAKIMATTDLAVEPKRKGSAFSNEALSTKILEFMSLGVPVIACRTKIHAYYYDDSIVQYYENDNEEELARQIVLLRNDTRRRNEIVSNAKVYASENTWDAKKSEYLDLVDSITAAKLKSDDSTPISNSSNTRIAASPKSAEDAFVANGMFRSGPQYALMTSAFNEEAFIEKTILAVCAQTILPVRWVIVSDGSTDGTDEIVKRYAAMFPFITYVRVEQNELRGVASKIHALSFAQNALLNEEHEFIGNLDADVSFEPDYFESLLYHLLVEPNLGISGGLIYEKVGGCFKERLSNSVTSVAHATQLVRRKCFEDIGGYTALEYGGEDWLAEIKARMRGWDVHSVKDLKVYHHRPTGGAERVMRHRMKQGRMDYSVGSHPLFEIAKCIRRIPERPILLGASWRFLSFFLCYLRKEDRLVSPHVQQFLRAEQMGRFKSVFRGTGLMNVSPTTSGD